MDKLEIKMEASVLTFHTQALMVSQVESVNGKTGEVLLNAADVGAEPLGSVANLKSYVDELDAFKADITYVDSEVGELRNSIDVKASKDYVDQQDQLLQDQIDLKANAQAINQVLSTKADLDESGKVPASQLPSFVDDVLDGRYVNSSQFNDLKDNPYAPESGKVYVDVGTNKTYRWSGMIYVVIGGSGVALGETSETGYRGDRGKLAYDHSQSQGNPHNSTTSDIPEGLRQYFTKERVRSADLSGFVASIASTITEADTVLGALGKAQAQINSINNGFGSNVRSTGLNGLVAVDTSDVTAGNTILQAIGKLQAKFTGINNTIRACDLYYLDVSQKTPINAFDTVLGAFGKLQGQINNITLNLAENIRSTTLMGLNNTSFGIVTAADTVLTGIGKLQAQFNVIENTIRSTALTGLSFAINSPISGQDSILVALGKIQAQLNASNSSPMVWVNANTLSGWVLHSAISSVAADTKIEICKHQGMIWVRGYFKQNTQIGMNAEIMSWTDTRYMTDVSFVKGSITGSPLARVIVGSQGYGNTSTLMFGYSEIFGDKISVFNDVVLNAAYFYIPPICLGVAKL